MRQNSIDNIRARKAGGWRRAPHWALTLALALAMLVGEERAQARISSLDGATRVAGALGEIVPRATPDPRRHLRLDDGCAMRWGSSEPEWAMLPCDDVINREGEILVGGDDGWPRLWQMYSGGPTRAQLRKAEVDGLAPRYRVLGDPARARNWLVVFSDIWCEPCRQFFADFFPVLRGRLSAAGPYAIVYVHALTTATAFPEAEHSLSLAECAARIGGSEVWFDLLMASASRPVAAADHAEIARARGVDGEALRRCAEDPAVMAIIARESGRSHAAFNLPGTPTLYFNGQRVTPPRLWEMIMAIAPQQPQRSTGASAGDAAQHTRDGGSSDFGDDGARRSVAI